MVGKELVGKEDKEGKAEDRLVAVEDNVPLLMLLRILCQSASHR
jgi:hypothetical protein